MILDSELFFQARTKVKEHVSQKNIRKLQLFFGKVFSYDLVKLAISHGSDK